MDICNLEFRLKSLNFMDYWFQLSLFEPSHEIRGLSVVRFEVLQMRVSSHSKRSVIWSSLTPFNV